jgi:hypothetical protein
MDKEAIVAVARNRFINKRDALPINNHLIVVRDDFTDGFVGNNLYLLEMQPLQGFFQDGGAFLGFVRENVEIGALLEMHLLILWYIARIKARGVAAEKYDALTD